MHSVGHEVRVEVPATSANLGPGYDCLGLALELVDELVMRREQAGSGLRIVVEGEGADHVPRDDSHLVVRALRAGLLAAGAEWPDVTLRCRNRIPHGRGLGSSSAAIVGGLMLARGLLRNGASVLDDRRMLALATDLEGHPDNVAPALLGGFTVAWTDGGSGRAVRLDPHPDLSATVFVPAATLSTERARGLLPAEVPAADASFNVARASLLVHAITSDPTLLFPATEDRLHQDYRRDAYPDSLRLVRRLRSTGRAAVISGAGPTVLVPVTGAGALPPIEAEGFTRRDLAVRPVGAI